ncbi:HD-GYP domain-containing protein [Lysobacter humi (ex Lee et al. 2017)]
MRIEEREIAVDQVAIGMYVCRLDRPWTDTPFPLQGFLVRDAEQVALLREHCRRLWIDIELGHEDVAHRLRSLPRATARSAAATEAPAEPAPASPASIEDLVGRHRYRDSHTLEEETEGARHALEGAATIAARLIDDIRRGLAVAPADVRSAAAPIVASVLRNADAVFWVNALRRHDGYTYSHAIKCSALAAAFGRHLGLPEETLVELASGALMMDIGKTGVPEELLAHAGPLDPMAMARVRRHVELGVQILGDGDFSDIVRDMVQGHHERADGTGYPARRMAGQIPLHVRMATIVDSFDAMTSERPHAAARPQHEALQELYRARETRYYPELVEQFISCLGAYPTGSLAELSTGEIVAIMAQNPARRLRPRVLVLTDPDGVLRTEFRSLDLLAQDPSAPAIEIRRPLPEGHAGIDLAELYL